MSQLDSECVRQSEHIVFSGLYLSHLSSVRANFLYEAKFYPCKHPPRRPADFDDFRQIADFLHEPLFIHNLLGKLVAGRPPARRAHYGSDCPKSGHT